MTEDADLFNHAYSLATEAPADADGGYIFKTLRACIPLAPSSQIFVIGRLAYRISMPSDTLYQQFLHVLHGDIQMNNAKSALNRHADKIETTDTIEAVKADEATDTVKVVSPLTAAEVEVLSNYIKDPYPSKLDYNRAKEVIQKLRACRLFARADEMTEAVREIGAQKLINDLFRKNDVRPGSTFTHGACIALLTEAIKIASTGVPQRSVSALNHHDETVTGCAVLAAALREAVKELDDIPPSIQTMNNIRLVNHVHTAIYMLENVIGAPPPVAEEISLAKVKVAP